MSTPPGPLPNSVVGNSAIAINWPLAIVLVAALTSFTLLAISHVIPEASITHVLSFVLGIVVPLPISRIKS